MSLKFIVSVQNAGPNRPHRNDHYTAEADKYSLAVNSEVNSEEEEVRLHLKDLHSNVRILVGVGQGGYPQLVTSGAALMPEIRDPPKENHSGNRMLFPRRKDGGVV